MDGKRWLESSALIIVVLAGACATPPRPVADTAAPTHTETTVTGPVAETPPDSGRSLVSRGKNREEELFFEALHQLAGPLNEETATAARQILESLLNGSPQSKWNSAAQDALRLIRELDANRQLLAAEQALARKLATDRNKTLQDNEQLRKELRLFNERHQAELAGLQEENEQLKKDLQLLKNLEIQLDRREKMLR